MANKTLNETILEIILLRLSIYEVAIPFMMSLCVAAVIANCLVLASMKFVRVRLNPSLKLAYSLSAADAWNSLVLMVGLIVNSYLPYVKFVPLFHRQDCIFGYPMEALRTGAMTTSVLHLLMLSLTHYGAIAHPVAYRQFSFNKLRINILVISLWIVPPLFFFLIFLAYLDETYNAEVCDGGQFLKRTGFSVTVFLLIFLPLMLMIAVYVKIMMLLSAMKFKNKPAPKKMSVYLNSDTNANTSEAASTNDPTHTNVTTSAQNRRDTYVQRKMKMVVTGMLIVSTFLIGWIPSSIIFALTCEICLYPQRNFIVTHTRLVFTLSITVNCLIIIKGLLNPLIYCIRIPEIKDALKQTYGCCLTILKHSKKQKYSSVSFEVSTYGDVVSTAVDGPSCDQI